MDINPIGYVVADIIYGFTFLLGIAFLIGFGILLWRTDWTAVFSTEHHHVR